MTFALIFLGYAYSVSNLHDFCIAIECIRLYGHIILQIPLLKPTSKPTSYLVEVGFLKNPLLQKKEVGFLSRFLKVGIVEKYGEIVCQKFINFVLCFQMLFFRSRAII